LERKDYFLVGVFIDKGVEVVTGEIRNDFFDIFSDHCGCLELRRVENVGHGMER